MSGERVPLGPWGWTDHGVGEIAVYDVKTESCVCILDDDTDESYAWPEDYSLGPDAVRNARLIAVSPKMYTLLEKWLHKFGSTSEISIETRKLLAEARGEQ